MGSEVSAHWYYRPLSWSIGLSIALCVSGTLDFLDVTERYRISNAFTADKGRTFIISPDGEFGSVPVAKLSEAFEAGFRYPTDADRARIIKEKKENRPFETRLVEAFLAWLVALGFTRLSWRTPPWRPATPRGKLLKTGMILVLMAVHSLGLIALVGASTEKGYDFRAVSVAVVIYIALAWAPYLAWRWLQWVKRVEPEADPGESAVAQGPSPDRSRV